MSVDELRKLLYVDGRTWIDNVRVGICNDKQSDHDSLTIIQIVLSTDILFVKVYQDSIAVYRLHAMNSTYNIHYYYADNKDQLIVLLEDYIGRPIL